MGVSQRLSLLLCCSAFLFGSQLWAADSLEIFEQRILPILNSPNPTSCSECHLGGVDLKDYIGKNQAETFSALLSAGLINTEEPDRSELLNLIRRTPGTSTIVSEKARQQEYEAFRNWIEEAVHNPRLAQLTESEAQSNSGLPTAVMEKAKTDPVLARFLDDIWSETGRCAACHSPEKNRAQVRRHGESISWIHPNDPEATLQYLLDNGLIDLDDPAGSLLLMKPTLQVEHEGGRKMVLGDRSYRQFKSFIDDLAVSRNAAGGGKMKMPAPGNEVTVVSEIWLRIDELPASLGTAFVRVDVHRWDEGTNDWSQDRWATAEREVYAAGRLWKQQLSLSAKRGSKRAELLRQEPSLPAGRYIARVFADADRDVKKFEARADGEASMEHIADIEIRAEWPDGYDAMTTVHFPGNKAPASQQ